MFDKPLVVLQLIKLFVSLSIENLAFYLHRITTRRSYELGANPKNIVIIGGSFAGWTAATRLAQSLPSGYRVILIEKNSHFFFTWNFPRSTSIPGHAEKAFVPYSKHVPSTPEEAYRLVRGTVASIENDKVVLEDGSQIDYEYLVIATGSHARYPSKLVAVDKVDAVKYFLSQQERIKRAQSIIIVGGGAAGMEIASDTKSRYPEKSVTLVHSRDRLLNTFGPKLHEEAAKALAELGVKLLLNERVIAGLDVEEPKEITLKSGTVLHCDTLIRCTGQSPNSDLIKVFSPSSIAPSGSILVDASLRIAHSPNPNLFAIGDVIDLPGPRLGRAASTQGMFLAANIVRAIQNKALKPYKLTLIDSSIELTLGLGKNTMYVSDGVREASFARKAHEDLFAERMWQVMGVKPFEDPEYEAQLKNKAVEAPESQLPGNKLKGGDSLVEVPATIV